MAHYTGYFIGPYIDVSDLIERLESNDEDWLVEHMENINMDYFYGGSKYLKCIVPDNAYSSYEPNEMYIVIDGDGSDSFPMEITDINTCELIKNFMMKYKNQLTTISDIFNVTDISDYIKVGIIRYNW